MAHYGELLDTAYDPNKDKLYTIFTEYFENPMMTKLKDVSNFSLYAAKIHCLLSTAHRYIMIFIDKDNMPLGNSNTLSEFKWLFLHTRTLEDNHNLQPQNYKPRRFKPLMNKISLTGKQKEGYTYSVDGYPLIVTLLPKTSGQMDYQNSGNIAVALETFNTIVSWA
jgi:hypothetical protein